MGNSTMKKLLLLLLFIPLVFSCSSSDEGNYTLILDTSIANPQSLVFQDICFNNECLTISKEVQTFTIENLSSTSDVTTKLNFACFSKPHNQDVVVNFNKGQTTTIKLTNHSQSQQGCRLTFTVSYD